MSTISYKVKLKNRRVLLTKCFNGGAVHYHQVFIRLGDVTQGEGKVVRTETTISEEAMNALVDLYYAIDGHKGELEC